MNSGSVRTRHSEILHSIVRAYIETGEPIGSRFLSRHEKHGLSPASIRNVMADLADEGFLDQPHTSAGRVPTEKAFRSYVSSIEAGRIPPGDAERTRAELRDLPTMEAKVERSSHILVDLTRNMGIAAAIPPLTQELDQIELIPLADQRVLMVLVTRDHMVRNRVVVLEEPATADELASIRNYVNRNFSGWQLGDARRELIRRMVDDRALYDAAMRQLQSLFVKGLLEVDALPDVHMEGAFNLVGLDLRLTRDKMRDLLHALNEKRRLIELLDRFLEPAGELHVEVGLEDAHPAMKDLSLIGMTIHMDSGRPVKVAVLGPMRMRYDRVMAAVLHTCRALEDARF